MDTQSHAENLPQEDAEAIAAWLGRNAIPLQHIEAGHGFDDLQPLKKMLAGVRIIGLGEATHGTREFFQVKHRLLEFLVTEMGFNAFAIEASYAACQPINDFVLHGRGDRAAVLTNQGYVPWDSEEFAGMLDWMRAYNRGVPDEKKVSFHGTDLWRNEIGRQAVLAYLRRVAPAEVGTAEALFEALAREEEKWPRRIDEECKKILREALPQLQEWIAHLTTHRDEFAGRTSADEFDHALHFAQVMQQWVLANTSEALQHARSPFMAENLIWLVEHGRPDARYVYWAHNGHISLGRDVTLGHVMREKYGRSYFAFGFEFNEGSFQTRDQLSPTMLGDLKAITLPPASAGSCPWYLSRTNIGNLVLDLRAPAGDPAIERWLQTPKIVHTANWVCPDGFQFNVEQSIAGEYDGIVFVKRTTPTRPTANALQTTANKAWL